MVCAGDELHPDEGEKHPDDTPGQLLSEDPPKEWSAYRAERGPQTNRFATGVLSRETARRIRPTAGSVT